MKLIAKTTKLAFVLTLIYIICRGMLIGFKIGQFPITINVNLFLLFVTQISYTLILVYLILVLNKLKAIANTVGMGVYLLLVNISFGLSFALGNGLITADNTYAQLVSITTISIFIALLFLIATSFRINPSTIGSRYRIFYISVIVVAILRALISVASIQWFPGHVTQSVQYSDIFSLLPAVALLYVIQRISFWLENTGNSKP